MYIWVKSRAAGRVGSDQIFCRQSRVGSGRVGSTFRRVGSGRVQEKWPVDNSDPAGPTTWVDLHQQPNARHTECQWVSFQSNETFCRQIAWQEEDCVHARLQVAVELCVDAALKDLWNKRQVGNWSVVRKIPRIQRYLLEDRRDHGTLLIGWKWSRSSESIYQMCYERCEVPDKFLNDPGWNRIKLAVFICRPPHQLHSFIGVNVNELVENGRTSVTLEDRRWCRRRWCPDRFHLSLESLQKILSIHLTVGRDCFSRLILAEYMW